ncbi:hypothetical protein [Flammeovirga agarivorans]|uniref:YokE-like PH domain-containing protein n=1 Tax=Flammeovirga agarivorans TaxID=2726742 RepID=A0A7X8XVG5_9BACT|nr:hypothetical protein [Flammeovirga agarivorans]NLR91040.1 hypothetical protein [Flammeovirga agarivorans]
MSWKERFNELEIKTYDKKALVDLLEQVDLYLSNQQISDKNIVAGTWASLMLKPPFFGLMLLTDNSLYFVGVDQKTKKLESFEWMFSETEKIEKLEDSKLGITKAIDIFFDGKQIRWAGMKGFIPSSFILKLEKVWHT